MPSTYINPLDFKKLFLEYFLGRTELFIFAIIILISFFAAKYQLSNRNFGVILLICSLIFAGVLSQPLYIIILVILGIIVFKSLARVFT